MKVISRLSCVSVLALTMSVASAQEARRGVWTNQQPQAGTVGANSPAGSPDRFALQNGLLFNALRVGDKVAFSSQEISGVTRSPN